MVVGVDISGPKVSLGDWAVRTAPALDNGFFSPSFSVGAVGEIV